MCCCSQDDSQKQGVQIYVVTRNQNLMINLETIMRIFGGIEGVAEITAEQIA